MLKNFSIRNGVTWSGYFLALCNSIDKMQTEQIIDIFKIVRLLRANRKQFIDQVKFVYFKYLYKKMLFFSFLESI